MTCGQPCRYSTSITVRPGWTRRGAAPASSSGPDVTTGAVVHGPAAWPLNVYDVQVADGSIRIRA